MGRGPGTQHHERPSIMSIIYLALSVLALGLMAQPNYLQRMAQSPLGKAAPSKRVDSASLLSTPEKFYVQQMAQRLGKTLNGKRA